MMRKRDELNARLIRATLGMRRVVKSWGVTPPWSICAMFLVMFAVENQAPDDETKAVIRRYTMDQMAQHQRPQYIIRQLWAIERFGAQGGW